MQAMEKDQLCTYTCYIVIQTSCGRTGLSTPRMQATFIHHHPCKVMKALHQFGAAVGPACSSAPPCIWHVVVRMNDLSCALRILPEGDRGMQSTNTTLLTFLYGATLLRTKEMTSCACGWLLPGFLTTHATGISPASSSGYL